MISKAGRPEYVAVLPKEDIESQMAILNRFYEIIDTLTHCQMLGLGRALLINPASIRQHYKTRRCYPGNDVAKRVIEWDQNGRPLTTRKLHDDWFDF